MPIGFPNDSSPQGGGTFTSGSTYYSNVNSLTLSNTSNTLKTFIDTKQNTLTASTNLLGVGSAITALDYNNITLNKPTNFQADFNSTVINKPSVYPPDTTNLITTTGGQTINGNLSATGYIYTQNIQPISTGADAAINVRSRLAGNINFYAETTGSINFYINGTNRFYVNSAGNAVLAGSLYEGGQLISAKYQATLTTTTTLAGIGSNLTLINYNTLSNLPNLGIYQLLLTASTTLSGIGSNLTLINYNTLSNLPNLALKENVLTFNAPLTRTVNTISLDLSTYLTSNSASNIFNTIANTTASLATKESILTFNAPLTRSVNTITLDLSTYLTSNSASNIFNTIANTTASLATKESILTFNAPLTRTTNTITLDLSTYLTSNNASNIFDTIAARNVALSSYLTTTTAGTTYLTLTSASSTYLTQTNATSTYQPKINTYTLSPSGTATFTSGTLSFDLSAYDTIAARNTALSSYLPLAGGTMSGNLTLSTGVLTVSSITTYSYFGGLRIAGWDGNTLYNGTNPIGITALSNVSIQTGTNLANYATRFFINTSGNVGIGITTGLSSLLTVNGSISLISNGAINFDTSLNDYKINLWGGVYGLGIRGNTLTYLSANYHNFYNSASSTNPVVSFDGSGNVSIAGTTTINNTLTIVPNSSTRNGINLYCYPTGITNANGQTNSVNINVVCNTNPFASAPIITAVVADGWNSIDTIITLACNSGANSSYWNGSRMILDGSYNTNAAYGTTASYIYWQSQNSSGGWVTNAYLQTTSTAITYRVNGNISCFSLTQTSSSNIKTDIQPIPNPLNLVNNLEGHYYYNIMTSNYEYGFIAEEMVNVIPCLVDNNPTVNQLGIKYTNLTAVLVEAIKEQQQQITKLTNILITSNIISQF